MEGYKPLHAGTTVDTGVYNALLSAAVASAQYREATKVFDRMPDEGQGLALVHFSAQPEPFLAQNTP